MRASVDGRLSFFFGRRLPSTDRELQILDRQDHALAAKIHLQRKAEQRAREASK